MRKLTIDQFIEKANLKHNFKYDYLKSIYIDSKEKIEIICPEHGPFWQSTGVHIYNSGGCQKCSTAVLLTKEEFVNKCKLLHGDKYDYSKVEFTGVKNKVIIICPTHGDFLQIAEKHFMYGCSACAED